MDIASECWASEDAYNAAMKTALASTPRSPPNENVFAWEGRCGDLPHVKAAKARLQAAMARVMPHEEAVRVAHAVIRGEAPADGRAREAKIRLVRTADGAVSDLTRQSLLLLAGRLCDALLAEGG